MSIIRFISIVLAVMILSKIESNDIRYLSWVIVMMTSALDITIREAKNDL